MFNMRSAWDTAQDKSVCAFACPLALWPERVVAWGLQYQVYSQDAPNCCWWNLGYQTCSSKRFPWALQDFSMNTLDRLFWCFWSSRYFSPAQISFLFEFFVPCPNLHCCWQLLWELYHKCMLHSLVQLGLSILQHTKRLFSSSEEHLYIHKDKNIKH